MGWKEREKGKENRGRGLKKNRKQGMKLGKGTNRIRKGKEINQDAHTGRYIKHQAIQIMDSLS